MKQTLKEKEERAAKEKAFEDAQAKAKADENAKTIETKINDAVKSGKIAPKNDALVAKLKGLDVDTVDAILGSMSEPAAANATSTNTNGKTNAPATISPKSVNDISEYLADVSIK
jgi:membrane protein involved in colicin uptake